MRVNRCAADCQIHASLDRRTFLAAAAAPALLAAGAPNAVGKIRPCGPASRCVPAIKACFVRRAGDYGLRWPGAIYDGEAARRMYSQKIQEAARRFGLALDLQPEPIHSLTEAQAWLAGAKRQRADGLLVVLLDRQEHAWGTAALAIESGIRTVVFSPVGTAFTVNTAPLAHKPGGFLCSTDDFTQVEYGLKMLGAAAKLAATRCIVLAGTERVDHTMPHLGIQLRYVPAREFLDAYNALAVSAEIEAMAADLIRGARRLAQSTEQDVVNGIKSYVVAASFLEREQGDAITMDCLGALGGTKISLPCIAWSKMNDDGIPAACEADLGAVATHCVVQYLFDRPGFQQDPVGESAQEALIGAHCSCPTRLNGFTAAPEPYFIQHHHAMRDATARTLWKEGQRMTCVDVEPGTARTATRMIISSGTVLKNLDVPPAGGCVVSVMVKLDGVTDVLAFPGFHQLFVYGDYKRQLVQFCRLMNIEAVVP